MGGLWLVFLLATAGPMACGDPLEATAWEIDPATASSEEPLYYRSTALWPQRDIPVCWTEGGFSQEKAWVKAALRGQRSWSSFGDLNFVGWGSCSGTSGGIRLTPGDTMVTRSLGPAFGSVRIELDFTADLQTRWSRCNANNLNRRDCLTTVALHEFGHALAFAHEQNRPSTPDSCTEPTQGPDGDSSYGWWDGVSIMNYCGWADELSGTDLTGTDFVYGARYGDAPRGGDFNGDGRDDLLCHDVVDGRKWIDYAGSGGRFDGTDWQRASNWCKDDNAELFKGDFNGDGRTDLLCHNSRNGGKWVDLADSRGRFNGSNWSRSSSWCKHNTGRLFVGDFNGDGRDDLLCHNVATGRKWVDYANTAGQFLGTNWQRDARWCKHDTARLFIGDFNGDGRDDLLCHDVADGTKWVDLADPRGEFHGSNWSRRGSWCAHDDGTLFIGDFNGDGRDDLLCHDARNGRRWIDYANSSGRFYGTDWSRSSNWCGRARLSVGDYNGDGRDDLLCHDVGGGQKLVDLANPSGQFFGTNWSGASGWCGHDSAELH